MNLSFFKIFRHTTLEFVGKVLEKDDVYTFSFKPRKPIKHTAGQHSLFVFPAQINARPFSLASSPDEAYVKVGTHVGSGSKFKNKMMSLQPGDTIEMFGPYLNFVPPNDNAPLIMLAQGIGITPFRSLLLWLARHEPRRVTHLLHVESAPHTYRSETEQAAVTSQYVDTPEAFYEGLRNVAAQFPDGWFFVCGSPRFVRSITEQLKAAGIAAKRIRKDGFLGY